ncbi:siderophore synthetase [Lampropedia aestuarii]|uniref:Siderophore synthetase n=1 Tax=Lampropedia aestuarii TaxID=2562762 RepID=A0A4S5BRK0_9BURK|nr:IucA/IucC family protein [Lampropedia aestuarii]THJ35200.1 siderophore synthetase [Lampropedia aestuarii]
MQDKLASLENLLHTRWSQALVTPAFKTQGVTLGQLQAALEFARVRSLQRLMQALLREGLIAASDGHSSIGAGTIFTLPEHTRVRFEYLRPGGMNSWDLRGQVFWQAAGQAEQPLRWPSQLLAVMGPSLIQQPCPQAVERLSLELDDSLINDSLCLAYHGCWSQALSQQFGRGKLLAGLQQMDGSSNPTLLLEQWGTLGHPWHPNYKTKLGPTVAQVIYYSPEFAARIEVRLCALHRSRSHIEAMPGTDDYGRWWSQHFPQSASALHIYLASLGLNSADYLPLPVHPWQAEDTLPKQFSKEIADRLLVMTDITAFEAAPTMSLRTVVPNASRTAPMVKLPVSMRLTTAQRTVSPRSVRMGPRVSGLLMEILARAPDIASRLDIIPERLGLHYLPATPDDDLARHLSVLYRDNPCSRLHAGETAIPVGSLFATDQDQHPLLCQWIQLAAGADDGAAMLDFFERYTRIAVPALLGLYLQYGIAFEAHQQNSFMVMDALGRPNRLLMRDFGDIRIHRASLHAQGLDLDLYDPHMTLLDDDNVVRDKLLHTSFMCHLGELVLLCARHWQVPEAALWRMLADQVVQCFTDLQGHVAPSRWQQERHALLEADWPAKAMLRMRLADCQEDIVGRLGNPLRAVA